MENIILRWFYGEIRQGEVCGQSPGTVMFFHVFHNPPNPISFIHKFSIAFPTAFTQVKRKDCGTLSRTLQALFKGLDPKLYCGKLRFPRLGT